MLVNATLHCRACSDRQHSSVLFVLTIHGATNGKNCKFPCGWTYPWGQQNHSCCKVFNGS